jgi:hypothetical protein
MSMKPKVEKKVTARGVQALAAASAGLFDRLAEISSAAAAEKKLPMAVWPAAA